MATLKTLIKEVYGHECISIDKDNDYLFLVVLDKIKVDNNGMPYETYKEMQLNLDSFCFSLKKVFLNKGYILQSGFNKNGDGFCDIADKDDIYFVYYTFVEETEQEAIVQACLKLDELNKEER